MSTTCIITCFNYQDFVKEAILSALAQTVPFDEIVIVDDASSDESPRIIDEVKRGHTNLASIRHEKNVGQLAAFETGIRESGGDLIFFLDADDVYAPNYLETCLSAYQSYADCEFLFCHKIEFDRQLPANLFKVKQPCIAPIAVTDLGYSLVRTLEEKVWIGAPTSCLSIRRSLAKRLFPLPVHEDWRTRADDCIVYGASLAGCRKVRLEHHLVGYRIHGNNAWAYNKRLERPSIFFLRQVAMVRLFTILSERFHLRNIGTLAQFEFKTIVNPTIWDLFRYLRFVIRNGARPTSRILAVGVLLKWYFRARRRLDNKCDLMRATIEK